ncbi:MAG TPA: hypothetical protein VGF75_05825 [Candidatus Saccharimonadales bacterium]|jgi:hypothetical protein
MSIGSIEVPAGVDQLVADEQSLRSYIGLLDQGEHTDPLFIELGFMLAGRVGEGVDPSGLVKTTEQLLEDCRKGADHKTGVMMPFDVIELPADRCDDFRYFTRMVTHRLLGESFGSEVDLLFEQIAPGPSYQQAQQAS